ncbi:MAG: hypothetical protein EAZ66_02910 [Alphaproteobacteria bacterium]|nr:MAG: hypothetical protein EAZ66_02910 [Alphaproteobacteria bacterium]
MAQEQNPDAYHGNGRLSQAVGKGVTYAITAGVVVLAAVMGSQKTITPTMPEGWGKYAAMAALGAVGAFGAVDGYNKADRSIQDHDRLAHDAEQARTIIHDAVNQGLLTPRDVAIEKS